LLGWSLGGYLAVRAAAFEPRLACVIAIDGVWSMLECFLIAFPEAKDAYMRGDVEACDRAIDNLPTGTPTGRRWIHDQMKYSFQLSSGFEVLRRAEKMTLEGIARQIKMPAFIAEATEDQFFAGQPAKVVKEIGKSATLAVFDKTQAAETHVSSGALAYLNQEILEWFAKVVGDKY
jgi:pimeloyl-ACP methyl ester carboxylesterase